MGALGQMTDLKGVMSISDWFVHIFCEHHLIDIESFVTGLFTSILSY